MRSSKGEYNYLFRKAVKIGLIDVPPFFVSYKYMSSTELKSIIGRYIIANTEKRKEIFSDLKQKIKLSYINDNTMPMWKHAEIMGIVKRNEIFIQAPQFKKYHGKEAKEIIFSSIEKSNNASILFRSLYKKNMKTNTTVNSTKKVNLTTAEIIALVPKRNTYEKLEIEEEVKGDTIKELALQQRTFIESIKLEFMGQTEDCYSIEELTHFCNKIGLNTFKQSKKELEQNIVKYITNTKLYALAVVSGLLL